MLSTPPVEIHPEVEAALQSKRPVVAVTSAQFTHTFPTAASLEIVRRMTEAVREVGGALAVIAVWEGRLRAGLSDREVEKLTRGGTQHLRATRRDLAPAILRGRTAGTSVSASMYIARRAGIAVLATGAIGGASRSNHQRDEPPWDITGDLVELLHTPVAVVSGGTRNVYKAHTAEVLETFRVPVIGYRSDAFPTFYMRAGSYPASTRAETPAEVAKLLALHWGMDGAGVVVAQPTPLEAAMSPDELLPALLDVEEQARKDNISRKDLSPFLMERLDRLTKGKALAAYQAILVANARLGAQIAGELLQQS